jgi:hypothetical protein
VTHALRVAEGSEAFRVLLAAVEHAGGRAGWLELPGGVPTAGEGSDCDVLGGAAAAADRVLAAGAWKVVAVAERCTVAVKRRRGSAVLRDLLREHFRGCRLVLVRGDIALPALRPRADGWELESLDGETRVLSTADLIQCLRAPRLRV